MSYQDNRQNSYYKRYNKRYAKANNKMIKSVVTNKLTAYKTKYVKAPTYNSNRMTAQQIQQYVPPVFASPSKYIKNMIYSESGNILSGTSSSIPQRLFRGNSVHDPSATGIGHQAIGHDQMMLFYEHFCVFRSKISVTFHNASAAPVKCGIYIAPDTTLLTTNYNIIENGYVKTIYVDGLTNGGSTTKTVNFSIDVKKYFGKSKYKDLMDDEKLTGDLNFDPVEQVYYNIFAYSPFGATEDIAVGIDVTLTYDTIYFEPKKIASS